MNTPMKRAKIQIVEDERIVAEDMRQCLEIAGYEVCGIAKSGELAIEIAEEHRPDLVLMDIVIRGDMDGIETAMVLRERFGIPVIYLTAYSQEGVLDRAKETQPLAYLIKPFKESTLLSTLEMALHKSALDSQLAESKELLHTTLRSIGDGVISTDASGRVVFMNGIAEELTAWRQEEASGQRIDEVFRIVNGETGEPVEVPCLRAMREGTVCVLERGTVLVRRDGSRLDVDDSGAPIHDEAGKLSGSVLIFRDVSGEMERERELESYRNNLEELVEHRTAQLERRIGLEGIISSISSDLILRETGSLEDGIRCAFEKIASFEDLGLVAFVPLGDGTCIVWPPEVEADAAPHLRQMARQFAEDPVYGLAPGVSVALEEITADHAVAGAASALGLRALFAAGLGAVGSSQDAMLLGSKVERAWNKEDRRILGMLGSIIHGVVERDRVEREKLRLAEELQQARKMEAIGKLSGGIAHDFNNMLVPIIGYSQSIIESGGAESEDEMSAILKAAQSAADLTKQLLAFSRKQILRKRPIDLSAVVAETRNMVERIIGEDVSLQLEAAADAWAVEADKGQIEQVLLNLCVNARDAMPAGGSIHLSVGNVELGAAPDRAAGDYVRMSVRDSGCGMTGEVRDRIFEPFYSTKGQQGTGLGLSVVLGIIEQHGGWIEVDSSVGEGSCFEIYLPADRSLEVAKDSGQDSGKAIKVRGAQQRILLVEDEPSVMSFVRQILEKNGYAVVGAANVASALETLDREAGEFDLLFTDAMLPDGTGIDVINRARKLMPDARILLSSGYSDDRSLLDQAQAQDIRFLPKPYTLEQLFAAVREALDDDVLIS